MTISSSLNAGVMGLTVNATRLATISDNIANSATFGYKRSLVDFNSLVLEQRTSAYSAGGVEAEPFKDIQATGSLISTGNSTDMAVAGRGLLPVTTSTGATETSSTRELLLTPTGSFNADADGNLRSLSGLFLLGWPADADGEVGNVSRNSGIDLEPVNISTAQFRASATTNIDLAINLPADATASTSSGDNVDLPIEYFDSLGRSRTLTITWTPDTSVPGASNRWTANITDNAGDPTVSIGTLDVTFSEAAGTAGQILTATAAGGATFDPTSGEISLNVAHGPITLGIGKPVANLGTNEIYTGITQLAAPFSPTAITKDGSPLGDLQSVEIDEKGFLQAVYDTGFRRTLYQIPIADVTNLNGLNAEESQSYSLSATSGDLYLWDAATGPVGKLSGYSLMESTTDIGTELTDLIETQRAYTSNAKIVQTVDEMLQETTNIKR